MHTTPKSLRTHIAIMGRTNAGKSSLLNFLARQPLAITSPIPGTTTDPVEKTIELAPLGPVVLIDTGGLDDEGTLGPERIQAALATLPNAEIALIITNGPEWTSHEKTLLEKLTIPKLIVRNKADLPLPEAESWKRQHEIQPDTAVIDISCKNKTGLQELIAAMANIAPKAEQKPLLADLAPENGLVLLVVPLDSGAPKGRLILPQVQAIRDLLDHQKMALTITEKQLPEALAKYRPDLVVCDSQVAHLACEHTPQAIPMTTFSILMARMKGDLAALARGAAWLSTLTPGDCIIIEEACTHHAGGDDIGTVKIPALLHRLAAGPLDIRHFQGRQIHDYQMVPKLIIHCGACMLTKTQMLARQKKAEDKDVPMTNYGMTLAFGHNVLERVLSPFPEALAAFQNFSG